MNSLYRESPVVDRSAVTNSTSQLDLTVLDRSQCILLLTVKYVLTLSTGCSRAVSTFWW
ncbi:hypothetical protein M405DRAFT_835669 [Rhizopogon salebrosus TDB-379]|nr:hypothetical protein M405DRAFT_835669 [Rhizopogon salebrosus TDB-379]